MSGNIRCTGGYIWGNLTPLVLSRLPQEIRMEWAREGEGKESDLTFLLEFLFKEIKRRERSETFQKTNGINYSREQSRAPPSVGAFHANSDVKQKNHCNFCKKTNHRSEDCYSLRNLNQKEIRERVKTLQLCYICFGRHYAKECNSRKGCTKCAGKHNTALCLKGSDTGMSGRLTITDESQASKDNTVNYAYFEGTDKTTVMQVVKTSVTTLGGESVEVNILFDGGSDRSFITNDLADRLKLKKISDQIFSFSGFGGLVSGPRTKRNIYALNVGGVNVELAGIDTLCADMYRAPVPKHVLRKFSIDFSEDFEVGRSIKVDLLIGLDYYWELVGPERIQIDALVAQKTRCGWMLSGAYAGKPKSNELQLLCSHNVPEKIVENLWELDAIGIVDVESPTSDKVSESFESAISYEEGRYCVALPWKLDQKGKLINNRHIAERRLQSLSRRLEGNRGLNEAYNQNLE